MCIYKTDDGKCEKFSDDKTTSYCINAPCEYEKLSNYDRIRNMSVDEMALFMNQCGHDFPPYCDYRNAIEVVCDQNCLKCAKQWLESEVK